MKRIFLAFIICLLIPSISFGDGIMFNDGRKVDESSLPQSNLTQDYVGLQYGATSLQVYDGKIDKVILDEYLKDSPKDISLFVAVAEASILPLDSVISDYYKAHRSIQDANSLVDLAKVVTPEYFETLKTKIDSGANEKTVLCMLQTLRPQNVSIIDIRANNNNAKVALKGDSIYGEVYGIARMVRLNGAWVFDRETWVSGNHLQIARDKPLWEIQSSTVDYQTSEPPKVVSLALNTPNYKINRNTLSLQHVSPTTRKDMFMFFFFMNKMEKEKIEGEYPTNLDTLSKGRKNMHILWTGPNNAFPVQTVVKNEYPVDVSIANDEDGYRPGELNLLFPRKKPRGVTAGLLWSF